MSRSRTYNCPNCGAPIKSGSFKCAYCGTEYDWIPVMKVEHLPANVKVLRAKVSVLDDVIRYMNDRERVEGHVRDLAIDNMRPKLREALEIKQQRDPHYCVTEFSANLRVILPLEE